MQDSTGSQTSTNHNHNHHNNHHHHNYNYQSHQPLQAYQTHQTLPTHHHQHQHHNHSAHIPPPHAHSLRSITVDSSSNSTKLTDYVTNHEIKFTKTEGCTPTTCVCLLMALLFVSIAASSGIYFGLRSFDGRLLKERVFKGQFTITRGLQYTPQYEKSNSNEFKTTAKMYANKIDKLFNYSHYSKAFSRSEIIALERRKDFKDDVIIHFNLHMSAQRQDIDAADLFVLFGDEILNAKYGVFKNVTIDYNSLSIQERRMTGPSPDASSAFLKNPWENKAQFPGLLEGLSTEPTPSPRRCSKIDLPYCNTLLYNKTSYPNIVGHWNISSIEDDFIAYRQIIDFECSPLAQEFICRLLQPECHDDEVVWPCREFCHEFFSACSESIPDKLINKFNCDNFPKSNTTTSSNTDKNVSSKKPIESKNYETSVVTGDKNKTKNICKLIPGCAPKQNKQPLSHRLCDGYDDCD